MKIVDDYFSVNQLIISAPYVYVYIWCVYCVSVLKPGNKISEIQRDSSH